MGDRERSGVYSAEAVLGRLVEKDKLYQEYRKAMEAAGDTAEPMRYVNENGRTVAADTSMEAVAGRRKEYEKMIEGPKGEQTTTKVSLQSLSGEERGRPERRRLRETERNISRDLNREKPVTLSRDRGMGR